MSLGWIDHSSRGALPSVVCLTECEGNPHTGGLGPLKLSKITNNNNILLLLLLLLMLLVLVFVLVLLVVYSNDVIYSFFVINNNKCIRIK
jgi:hypothetical protein